MEEGSSPKFALAREHRVFAIDWPKHGVSLPWEGLADHERMLRVIGTVLDHFHLDKVALVGLSQGEALSIAYAIEHPERVDRIVALAPGVITSFPPIAHQVLWLTAKSRFLNRTLTSWVFRSRVACAWFAREGLLGGPVEDFDDIVDEYHAHVLANGLIADFFAQEGMPLISGRVIGWLLISDPPEQSAADLARVFEVSCSRTARHVAQIGATLRCLSRMTRRQWSSSRF